MMKRKRPCAKAHANPTATKTTLPGIQGHHRIADDEEVDACAKQATAVTNQTPRPGPFVAASALIYRKLTLSPPCHCRTKEAYTKMFSWPADCRTASARHDATLLARLRAGHTPHLKAYANQLETTVDSKCPSCGEEPETVDNWLQQFPNTVELR